MLPLLRELLLGNSELNASLGETFLNCFDIHTARHVLDMEAERMKDMMQIVRQVSNLLRIRPERLTHGFEQLVKDVKKAATKQGDPIQPANTLEVQALMELEKAFKAELLDRETAGLVLSAFEESQRLACESVTYAAQALLLLQEAVMPEKENGLKEEEMKRWPLKQARVASRDYFLWRCKGSSMRIDSQSALEVYFPQSDNPSLRSQLIGSYAKIREKTASELVAVPKCARVRRADESALNQTLVQNTEKGEAQLAECAVTPPPGLAAPSTGLAAPSTGLMTPEPGVPGVHVAVIAPLGGC